MVTLRRFLIGIPVLAFAVFGAQGVFAEMPIVGETYDIDPAACDGLYLNGVTYAFTVGGAPSLDCTAGTFVGPGITNNIDAPNIEGTSSGVLHMRFDVPTTVFGFGVALNTFSSPQVQSVIVNLNRPGVGLLREEVFLDATSDPAFVGGRFDYGGPAVRTVTVQFSGGAFVRFAMDNLNYFRPPGQTKK